MTKKRFALTGTTVLVFGALAVLAVAPAPATAQTVPPGEPGLVPSTEFTPAIVDPNTRVFRLITLTRYFVVQKPDFPGNVEPVGDGTGPMEAGLAPAGSQALTPAARAGAAGASLGASLAGGAGVGMPTAGAAAVLDRPRANELRRELVKVLETLGVE